MPHAKNLSKAEPLRVGRNKQDMYIAGQGDQKYSNQFIILEHRKYADLNKNKREIMKGGYRD